MASLCCAAQPDGDAGAYWAGMLRGALYRLATAADPLFPWLERELRTTAAALRLRPISGLSIDEVMPCVFGHDVGAAQLQTSLRRLSIQRVTNDELCNLADAQTSASGGGNLSTVKHRQHTPRC